MRCQWSCGVRDHAAFDMCARRRDDADHGADDDKDEGCDDSYRGTLCVTNNCDDNCHRSIFCTTNDCDDVYHRSILCITNDCDDTSITVASFASPVTAGSGSRAAGSGIGSLQSRTWRVTHLNHPIRALSAFLLCSPRR